MTLSEYSIRKIQENIEPFEEFMLLVKTLKKIEARKIQTEKLADLLNSEEQIDSLSGEELNAIKRIAAKVVNYGDPESAKNDFERYNPNLTEETFRNMLKKLIFPKDPDDKHLSDRFGVFTNVIKTFGPSGTSALLSSRYPERYGLWTKTSFRTIKLLRITLSPQRETYKINGNEYEAYNKKIKEIQTLMSENDKKYSLRDLDGFMYFLTSR